jgi:ProP effector
VRSVLNRITVLFHYLISGYDNQQRMVNRIVQIKDRWLFLHYFTLYNKGTTMRKQELHPRTAVLNKNQKNKSKKARTDALSWLAVNFPNAFDNSVRISPLKLGIMDDILQYADKAAEAGISKSKLREAVVLFTRRLDYLICLKSREMRIDLQGNALSEVTEEEADHATTKIKKRVEKSVRNARKIMAEKNSSQPGIVSQQSSGYISKSTSQSTSGTDDYLPTYPARGAAYSTQNAPAQPSRAAAVIVKHKTTRQYDPDAVARLKEKLGLSRSLEEKKETVE